MLMQVQSAAGWVGPTVAISLVIVAVSFIVTGGVLILTARAIAQAARSGASAAERLEAKASTVLDSVQAVAEDGREISAAIRGEAKSLLKASRRLRKGVKRGAGRVEQRLEELDALYEVLYEEVEDTALGVAATLRTARRARGVLSPLSRLWRRRRR